jgi:hypothetical protein
MANVRLNPDGNQGNNHGSLSDRPVRMIDASRRFIASKLIMA